MIYLQISCIAANYRVPFHVFCETYKFSTQNLLDAFVKNELDDPSKVINEPAEKKDYQILNLRYDMTPKENVSMVSLNQILYNPNRLSPKLENFLLLQFQLSFENS
jgi:translation initiation factor 2B subunit (eIF-2B alpha/beta/delta family)